jgi:formylglycine-generating enzyme required for sulfatase activity
VFDENETSVGVVYHAHEPNSNGFAQGREAWQDIRGSGKWIDLVYELPKARLANGDVFDADFFVITNRSQLAIHSVTLERVSAKPPADFTNALGMEFVRVPAGKSWLGGGGGKPGTQEVTIHNDLYLGKFEVTQQEWEQVMGGNPSWHRQVSGVADDEMRRFPVEMVSWHDAQEFVRKLNERAQEAGWVYRLPTEEEWEYACRGGVQDAANSGFDFYFAEPTNSLLQTAANFGNQPRRTCQVGLFAPNRLGLYDMHGNVEEWCAEEHGAAKRPVRGGDWGGSSHSCRAAERRESDPADKNNLKGLRVARVPLVGAWQPLFNGKDLSGWEASSANTTKVGVVDGVRAIQMSGNSGLRANQEFHNYHLRYWAKQTKFTVVVLNLPDNGALRWMCEPPGGAKSPLWVWGTNFTYQAAELRDGVAVGTGKPIGDTSRLSLSPASLKPADQWQQFEVIRLGATFVFRVNGQTSGVVLLARKSLDDKIDLSTSSRINMYTDTGEAAIRNIEIREISALPPDLVE